MTGKKARTKYQPRMISNLEYVASHRPHFAGIRFGRNKNHVNFYRLNWVQIITPIDEVQ